MSEQHFTMLHKDDPISWAFMPYALDRITRFCVEHQTDMDGRELARIVGQSFLEDDPLMLCAVCYEKGVGVFAHALACIENITGNKFLTILQMETDRPFADRKALKRVWEQFRAWGLKHMAGEARLVTRTPAQAKVFERYYGFKQLRIVMSKSLMEN